MLQPVQRALPRHAAFPKAVVSQSADHGPPLAATVSLTRRHVTAQPFRGHQAVEAGIEGQPGGPPLMLPAPNNEI